MVDTKKREKIETLLSSLGLILLDTPSAKAAGLIHSESYRQGKPIGPEDSMIAGIARHHSHPIVARNVKHFKGIPGVEIELY